MKKPTTLMIRVLDALASETQPIAANRLAHKLGFHTGQDLGRHSHNGRTMAPAQRVTHPLIGLRERGLVAYGARIDGLSGSAYVITETGRAWLREHPIKVAVAKGR